MCARYHFIVLVEVFLRHETYPCHLPTMLNLILYKAADPNLVVRKSAVQLLQLIEERFTLASMVADYRISLTSSLPTTYKQSQTILSAQLAMEHAGFTYDLLAEVSRRLDSVPRERRRDMLNLIHPWLAHVHLSIESGEHPNEDHLSLPSAMVLNNLFVLTIKCGDEYNSVVETLWMQLCGDREANVPVIVSYLLSVGLHHKNPDFVAHAKKIIVYMGRSKGCGPAVVMELVSEILPATIPTTALLQLSSKQAAEGNPGAFFADLDDVLPQVEADFIERHELALVLLVDLALEVSEELRPHLPDLLHAIVMQLDAPSDVIFEQSRLLFINIIHSLVARHTGGESSRATTLILLASSKEGSRWWARERRASSEAVLASEGQLAALVANTVDVFSEDAGFPDLSEKWLAVALRWIGACDVAASCRSAQVDRALKVPLSQQLLGGLLDRLSEVVSSPDEKRTHYLYIFLCLLRVSNWVTDQCKPCRMNCSFRSTSTRRR